MYLDIINKPVNYHDVIVFGHTVLGKCVQFQPFQQIIEHNIDLLAILFYCISAKTEKAAVLHHLKAYFHPLTSTNEPVANVISMSLLLYHITFKV